MSAIFDNLIAYKIITMLLQPYTETDAFKLGIIDADGNTLIQSKNFRTSEQKDAYNKLTKMVFIVKQLLSKVPGTRTRLKGIVGAFMLVKEAYKSDDETMLTEDNLVETLSRFKYVSLVEETLMVEEVATTNTAGVSGLRVDDVAVNIKKKKALKGIISRLNK